MNLAPDAAASPHSGATPLQPAADEDAGQAAFRNRLVRLGIVNNLTTVVTLLVGLVMVPVMLSGLGSERYGTWIMIVSLNGLILSMDLGLNMIVTRQAARWDTAEANAATAVVRAAGGALLLAGIFAMLAMVIIGLAVEYMPLPGRRIAGGGLVPVFTFVGVGLLAEQLTQYSVAVMSARMRFGLANAVLSGGAVLRAVLVAAAIFFKTGLSGVAGAYAAAAVLTAVAAASIVGRVSRAHAVTSVTFDLAALRPQIGFGLSSVLATIAGAILWQAHPLIIGTIVGTSAVAVFFVGIRLPTLVSEMSWRGAEVLMPAVSATDPAGDVRRATALSSGVRALLLVVVPIAVIVTILAGPVLELWLRDAPSGAVTVLRLGALVMLLDACAVPALQVLWGLGKASSVAFIMGAAAAVAVAADLLLLPVMGAVAAPLAMIGGLTLISSAAIVQAARQTGATVAAIVGRDMTAFVPAAIACAAGATLGFWIGTPRQSLGQLAMGSILGFVGYFGMIWASSRNRPEQDLLRDLVGGMSAGLREVATTLRTRAKRVESLRSAWYLFLILRRRMAYRSSSTSASLDQLFAKSPDPWQYTSPGETRRHEIADELVASIPDERAIDHVLEIGCAEGTFTERLARRSKSLLSVDFSNAALERARRRRAWDANVQFAQLDLARDAMPGSFTLVVVMDVLTYFESVSELKAIRQKIVDSLVSGGWLLIGDVRQSEVYERSWWGRHLLCGGLWICEFVAQHERLVVVRQAQTATHVFRLLRKTM